MGERLTWTLLRSQTPWDGRKSDIYNALILAYYILLYGEACVCGTPYGRFSVCKNRQDQRCKEFLMQNALRVLSVVHKGALPITNPAHS